MIINVIFLLAPFGAFFYPKLQRSKYFQNTRNEGKHHVAAHDFKRKCERPGYSSDPGS